MPRQRDRRRARRLHRRPGCSRPSVPALPANSKCRSRGARQAGRDSSLGSAARLRAQAAAGPQARRRRGSGHPRGRNRPPRPVTTDRASRWASATSRRCRPASPSRRSDRYRHGAGAADPRRALRRSPARPRRGQARPERRPRRAGAQDRFQGAAECCRRSRLPAHACVRRPPDAATPLGRRHRRRERCGIRNSQSVHDPAPLSDAAAWGRKVTEGRSPARARRRRKGAAPACSGEGERLVRLAGHARDQDEVGSRPGS